MTIFFTGCTHFGHKKIIQLADRPFESVEEMDAVLIERWNKKVKKSDTVYHLGDVTFGDMANYIPTLNGRKILIRGNHDPILQDIRSYSGFDYVLEYLEIGISGTKVVLFHYPIDDWNGRWKGHLHFHCHTHQKEVRNPNIPRDEQSGLEIPSRFPADLICNRFNVGVDACGFAPVSIDEILQEAYR